MDRNTLKKKTHCSLKKWPKNISLKPKVFLTKSEISANSEKYSYSNNSDRLSARALGNILYYKHHGERLR